MGTCYTDRHICVCICNFDIKDEEENQTNAEHENLDARSTILTDFSFRQECFIIRVLPKTYIVGNKGRGHKREAVNVERGEWIMSVVNWVTRLSPR
jgi:hypothetical protein